MRFVVDVVRKALEGEVRLSGSCLFSSRAVNKVAGAVAKSRGSRASATREGALASVGFLAGWDSLRISLSTTRATAAHSPRSFDTVVLCLTGTEGDV